MSFLNPAILIALTAISIPILIHLLNLRKIRKVEFSTLMFLKEIQKSKMRRIKLKQILLLLLRVFTIAFLVLCFARPVYEGFAGSDAASRTTTLIFIDDSFSMNVRDNRGLYLAQAKEAVKKILESHKETDEIYLIPSSKISMKENKVFYNNFKELFDSLDKIKFSYKPFSVSEVLNYSNHLLGESKNSFKEVFIISDFQKNNFALGSNKPGEFENLNESSVNTYLINIGEREVNNLSLDSFIVVSKILEKDREIKIKIFLNNHTQFNVKNKIVNLYIEGELKGEKAIDVNSFERKEIEFTFKAGKTRSINGMVDLVQNEFSDDEIIQDNKYFFSFYIPEKFNIGFIEENSSAYNFLNLAFQSAANILSDSLRKASELFQVNHEKSIDENIFKNNVLFIAGKKSFSDNEASLVKDFISNGGGVFLFPGSDIDINNYNNTILSKLNTLKIEKLNIESGVNENLKFGKVDFENPVLSEVFQNQNLNITSDRFNIESPKINSYFELLLSESSNPVITLSNNLPFLVESKFSKGKIIMSSVSASNDMSDLPLKSIFVPLIIRSVYYLGNDFEYQREYIVGNSNLISIKNLNDVSKIYLPDKSAEQLKISLSDTDENFIMLPYSGFTSETGNYILEDSSGNKFSFTMNFDPEESSLSKMTSEELEKFFSDTGINKVKLVNADDDVTALIEESRTGIGLWKYFLLGAIIFLIAELMLSKKLEKS